MGTKHNYDSSSIDMKKIEEKLKNGNYSSDAIDTIQWLFDKVRDMDATMAMVTNSLNQMARGK